MAGVVSGVDEVGSVLSGLAVSWVDDLSDDALLGVLAELEAHRRLLDATVLHLVAEADGRRVTDATVGLSTTTWMSRAGRQSLSTARRRVIVARALERFCEVDAALVKGEIGFEHAWVIIEATTPRIVDAMVELQGRLLDLVPGHTFARWRTEVHRIAALLDDRHHTDRDADPSTNRMTLTRDPANGSLKITGRFVGSWAETIATVVPAIADELFHRFTRDATESPDLEVPDRSTLLALALEEACRRAAAVDLDTTTAPTTDATIVIPAVDTDPIDVSDPDHRHPAWFGVHPSGVGHTHAETPDGHRLADDTTTLLCCDPSLHTVIIDRLGRPLDLSRRTRFASPAQRRATAARDGGCVFPGCHAPPPWCDLHHVTPFPDGPTDLPNLATLCRHHHRVTHRRGWQMHATNDQWFWWRTPTGHTTWSQRHQHQRPGPTPDG